MAARTSWHVPAPAQEKKPGISEPCMGRRSIEQISTRGVVICGWLIAAPLHRLRCIPDSKIGIAAMILIIVVLVVPVMSFPVAGDIYVLIPSVSHKISSLAASMVFVTVLAPVLRVARRYAQIDRGTVCRYPLNDDRLIIDDCRWLIAADIDSTVEPGITDANRDADVSSECQGSAAGKGYYRCNQNTFHGICSRRVLAQNSSTPFGPTVGIAPEHT